MPDSPAFLRRTGRLRREDGIVDLFDRILRTKIQNSTTFRGSDDAKRKSEEFGSDQSCISLLHPVKRLNFLTPRSPLSQARKQWRVLQWTVTEEGYGGTKPWTNPSNY